MDGFRPPGIYVLAVLLYTLPCILPWAAWKRETGTMTGKLRLPWRVSCLKSGFIGAASATALSLVFLLSDLQNGRGIHGSHTTPGLWTTLGTISVAVQVLSLMLAAIGKTNVKLFLIGWIVAVSAAEYIVFQVAFD
jgi:hypothetical protein